MGSINRLLVGINDLATVNPYVSEEWNYKKNKGLRPDQVSANTNKKVWWKCSICGNEWEAIVSQRNRSNQHGCPTCAKKRGAKLRREAIIASGGDLATKYPELIEEWDFEKNGIIKPADITPGGQYKAWWKCKYCGNSWQALASDRVRGAGCPKCFFGYHTSYSEQAIYYYVKHCFPSAINSYRDTSLGRYEIDIFIPELKVGIEYDGQNWHRDVERDRKKDKKISSCGIDLIRIRESKCPVLTNSSSYVISVVAEGDQNDYLSIAITELFDYLREIYHLELNVAVDLHKDQNAILSAFEHNKRDKSVSANPALLAEWDYEKNGTLKPEQVHIRSKRKVWWKCSVCGYEWQSVVYDKNAGHGCPSCAGRTVNSGVNDLLTVRPEIAAEWDYEKNGNLKPEDLYYNSNEVVWWKCSSCGKVWKASVSSRENANCKTCNYRRVAETRHLEEGVNDIASSCPELMLDWDYDKNECDPKTITTGSHKKIHWKCSVCGYAWVSNVYDRTNGHGCPRCAKKAKSSKLSKRNLIPGVTDLASKFPEVAKDWDYEENELTPNMISFGSSKRVAWRCSKCGHQWKTAVSNRTSRHSKCPKCHGKGFE